MLELRPYWKGTLVAQDDVVHVVWRNHGVRIRFYCHDNGNEYTNDPKKRKAGQWANISTLKHGEYTHPTCLACMQNDHAIRHLRSTQEWMVERDVAEARLAGEDALL